MGNGSPVPPPTARRCRQRLGDDKKPPYRFLAAFLIGIFREAIKEIIREDESGGLIVTGNERRKKKCHSIVK
jgi:hypothetical protein